MTSRTQSQPLVSQGLAFPLKVFQRVVLKDTVSFEESIEFNPCQPEHRAQLRFGDVTGAEFLQRKAFQRAAGQIAPHLA